MSVLGMIKDAVFGSVGSAQATAASASGEGGAMPQLGQAGQPVDVEQSVGQRAQQSGKADLNWRNSIVDLMKVLDLDSSLDNRKQLATELGYTGAKDGSAEMNIWLHRRVMEELERQGGVVPESLKH